MWINRIRPVNGVSARISCTNRNTEYSKGVYCYKLSSSVKRKFSKKSAGCKYYLSW